MPEQESSDNSKNISRDTLFDGELFCCQHIAGYRFSIDAVLLAHFVRPAKDEVILDLGAGCGVVGLILLYRHQNNIASLLAFELQAGLVELIRENRVVNHFQDKMTVMQGDLCLIKDLLAPESFSTVVCNPPFYKEGSGRQNSETEIVVARHQVACSLLEILAAASTVKNKGRLILIYPSEGIGVLLSLLANYRLVCKRLQFVYSYPETTATARLVLVEAVKNGGEGVEVSPPFFIYESRNGPYSKEMQKMYTPNQSKL